MEYTNETRRKLYQECVNSWKKRLFLASSETRKQAEELENMNAYHGSALFVRQAGEEYQRSGKGLLSVFFKKKYKSLVKAFVDRKYLEDFYGILDKQNQFPYSRGWYRRTVRSAEYTPFLEESFRLLLDYRTLGFYGGSLEKYLKNELSPEWLDMKRSQTYWCRMTLVDHMIAARIDAGDAAIIGLVREMILSDNNTAILTTDVIRGIVKSSDHELHQLLADFLVAARLQEGVRQAICENADCGTVAGFLTIFDAICDHDLIRYAAVKRAVATWTGIGSYEDADRISAKVVEDIRGAVDDVTKALEFTESNDSIHILIGLWSLGFRDVQDAIRVMKKYLVVGTRNQILTMSYYNRQLQAPVFTQAVAKEVIKRYADMEEPEYVAAFLPSYLGDINSLVGRAITYKRNQKGENEYVYASIPVTEGFRNAAEAREQFGYLKDIYEKLPKKKLVYSPCVFPWYGVELTKSDLVKRMCCIAYMLQEETLILSAAKLLEQIDSDGYPGRGSWVRLLLHKVETMEQQECLVTLIQDKSTSAREAAYELLKDRSLTREQYLQLEGFLRFKNSDIRSHVLELLGKQEPAELCASVKRLLLAENEELREGGRSLELQMKKEPILDQEGYGIYEPGVAVEFPKETCDKAFLKDYFSVPAGQLEEIFEKLRKFLDDNGEREYKNARGETVLLENGFYAASYDQSLPVEERYPFKELWMEFYEREIGSPDLLNLLIAAAQPIQENKPSEILEEERKMLGSVVEVNQRYRPYRRQYTSDYQILIFQIMRSIYGTGQLRRVGLELLKYMVTELPEKRRWYSFLHPATSWQPAYEEQRSIARDFLITSLTREAVSFGSDEEFQESFRLCYQMDQAFRFREMAEKNRRPYYYSSREDNHNLLGILEYVKACVLGMIPKDMVYKAIFETYGLSFSLQELGLLYKEKWYPYEKQRLRPFLTEEEVSGDEVNHDSAFFAAANEIYQQTVDCILDVELKRGDLPTVFSESAVKIQRFYGMDRLVQILVALGKDKLNRSQYYGWRRGAVSRQESFSHLLKVSWPLPEEGPEKLSQLLKCTKVTRQRLIEVAMYAPQWMDIFEKYLEYPGFTLGCYYFMAHMNEYFDDRKKAVIARYTPLTIEELNQGAFDVNWFTEAYEQLGEDRFDQLYDAAKYISDGGKHARARKYADAALGRVTEQELEQAILEKRNKDLLMSYGLVPFSGKAQLVHRYEFIQRFRKESSQFGAQRRASESAAADMALRNLAMKAGYEDVTRLSLAMETELVRAYKSSFAWQQVEDCRIRLAVDELGNSVILCEKNEKSLKSVPAALKKNETVIQMKELQRKLREQYARTVKMFETAMETGEWFGMGELVNLLDNPVTAAVVGALVFVTEDGKIFGFPGAEGLHAADDSLQTLDPNTRLRVAHAFDLYQAGVWHSYQEYFYRKAQEGTMRKQPFKQVFRELYVKLPEETDMLHSLMFAGNQIQPKKTVACLKGRRWVADYEDGLQKIYYKQDIVARIYALADWFSPSDMEEPTLEWVEFSNRKTCEPIAIKDVPDIIYSEVMRDVDLAVSVAHAGGVDPETSHSTIEMRKVIVSFNLPLFGLTNVELSGSHAFVSGKLGRYSIHLGSGVIHQVGGHQIHVLPVHSQNRGKLFLPFVDEDPKTAEIMSKIVLFAGDEKIKDPYILEQII